MRALDSVWVLLGALCLVLACAGEARTRDQGAEGAKALPLELTLAIEPRELVAGEDATLVLSLANAGGAPLEIPDPERSSYWPKLHVRDVERGGERAWGPADRVPSHDFRLPPPEIATTLAPGARAELRSTLLSRVELAGPGRYEIRAVVESGGVSARSAPVEVRVDALVPGPTATAGATSGAGDVRYVAWTHRGAPGRVLVSQLSFSIQGEPVVGSARRVASGGADRPPVLSVSQNGLPYPSHWIAWGAGGAARAREVVRGEGSGPVLEFRMDEAAVVIPPVLLDLRGADGLRPGRGILATWRARDAAGEVGLRVLEATGVRDAGVFRTGGGRLAWGQGFALGSGERWVLIALASSTGFELELVRFREAAEASGRASSLGRFDAELLGAAAVLDPSDVLHGVLVLRESLGGGAPRTTVRRFRIDGAGKLAADAASPLPVSEGLRPRRALAATSASGSWAALLEVADGEWLACAGGGACRELGRAWSRDRVPVGVHLLAEQHPLVLVVRSDRGPSFEAFPAP